MGKLRGRILDSSVSKRRFKGVRSGGGKEGRHVVGGHSEGCQARRREWIWGLASPQLRVSHEGKRDAGGRVQRLVAVVLVPRHIESERVSSVGCLRGI